MPYQAVLQQQASTATPQQSTHTAVQGGFKHLLRPIQIAFHGMPLGKQPPQGAVIVGMQSDPSDN